MFSQRVSNGASGVRMRRASRFRASRLNSFGKNLTCGTWTLLLRRARQWAAQIVSRFFTRYGQPHYAEESLTEFAEAFSKQLAPKILEQVRVPGVLGRVGEGHGVLSSNLARMGVDYMAGPTWTDSCRTLDREIGEDWLLVNTGGGESRMQGLGWACVVQAVYESAVVCT